MTYRRYGEKGKSNMATKFTYTDQRVKIQIESGCNKLINVIISSDDDKQDFKFTTTLDCIDSFSDSLMSFCKHTKLALEEKEW